MTDCKIDNYYNLDESKGKLNLECSYENLEIFNGIGKLFMIQRNGQLNNHKFSTVKYHGKKVSSLCNSTNT